MYILNKRKVRDFFINNKILSGSVLMAKHEHFIRIPFHLLRR